MAMSGSTNAQSICIPSKQLCVDVGISSINSNQVKEMTSSLYEHAIKVRKPYMITKQRERWSEEEHEKFLEALKLHGRAWRQIEEHIGTKTAVQIRSHAQKFFSKVAHESTGDSSGSVKMIAIPPPRPKRKPAHPYPRKFGNQQKMPILEQPEMSYLPTPSPLEEENRSPTSVLLAFRSDSSPASNLPSGCTSPLSSMAGSNQVQMLLSQCQLPVAASDEEEISPSPGSKDSATDVDAMEDNTVYEVPSVESQTKSLKLFGRTVLVSGSQNTCPSEGSCLRRPKPSGTIDVENCYESGLQTQAQSVQKTVDSDVLLTEQVSAWSAWYGGTPPMFMCPIPGGDSGIPLSWGWAMYGTPQFQYSNVLSTSANQNPSLQHKVSVSDSNTAACTSANQNPSLQHQVSVSDSNTAACQIVDSQIPTIQRTPPSNLRHSANSAFSSFGTGISKSARGFKPYKRCVSPKAVLNIATSELDGDAYVVELCL